MRIIPDPTEAFSTLAWDGAARDKISVLLTGFLLLSLETNCVCVVFNACLLVLVFIINVFKILSLQTVRCLEDSIKYSCHHILSQ